MPGETADSSLADVDAKAARARIDPERAGCRRGPERHQQEGAVDARGHTSDPGESSPAVNLQGSRQGQLAFASVCAPIGTLELIVPATTVRNVNRAEVDGRRSGGSRPGTAL